MELRTTPEYGLVGCGELTMISALSLVLSLSLASAESDEKITETRSSISETERKQREALAHLFVINKRIKEIAQQKARLQDRLYSREAAVRETAQDVLELEKRSDDQRDLLAARLRQLYQSRAQKELAWIFSAKSPVELDRNRRYLRKMVDSDHRQLSEYLHQLRSLQKKKVELAGLVRNLLAVQKSAQSQERELTDQMREKSKLVGELRRAKDSQISTLKSLRENGGDAEALDFAFFERKGTLRPPIDAKVVREFGTFVDPEYRYRLMYKGNFYSSPAEQPVTAVFAGQVAVAEKIPGYGPCVIVDHGDNYYSVYAFASRLNVRPGARIKEGDIVAYSGRSSPLFGPGLYFEIRHFADAIDPRPWIKDSGIKTARAGEGGVQ